MTYLTKTVRLNGSVPRNESLEFVEVELFTKPEIPFAIVKYKLQGALQTEGLRLDLDKQVFLDHLDSAAEEAVAATAASAIVEHLFQLTQKSRGRAVRTRSAHSA